MKVELLYGFLLFLKNNERGQFNRLKTVELSTFIIHTKLTTVGNQNSVFKIMMSSIKVAIVTKRKKNNRISLSYRRPPKKQININSNN